MALRKQLVRYLIGGVSTAVLNFSCVWVFTELLGIHYLLSVNLAVLCVYFYSYLVNKVFVFSDHKSGHVIKGSKFFVLQISLLILANSLMYVSVSLLEFHYMRAVVAVSILAAIINFTVMRRTIFEPAGSK